MNPKDLKKSGVFIGRPLFFPTKSIQTILDNLQNGEEIQIACQGSKGSSPGVLAVTDRRLIFASKIGLNFELRDLDLDKITGIQVKGSFSPELEIKASSDEISIKSLTQETALKIMGAIKQ